MDGLRGAFLGVIESLRAPEGIHRAADLERLLGLSTTLAWQIHRIATSPNPLDAGPHVPGVAAMNQALKAARSAGADADALRRAAQAMEVFEAMVEQHAGDRSTFTTMINSLAGRESEVIDLKTRRQAFRVASRMWGVQVKTLLSCALHYPGRESSLVDTISIRGLRDIRRLRAGASMRVSGYWVKDAQMRITEPHAIGDEHRAAAPEGGPQLLLDFCTKPCPELEHRVKDGHVNTYLRETPLGNAGAQTLYLADITQDIEWRSPDESQNVLFHSTATLKPIEVLVLDTLIHRDMFGTLEPQVKVFGSLERLGATEPGAFESGETLPILAEVHSHGTGLAVLPTPHVPRYREMVESVCRRAGWDPDSFELFRCVMEYPQLSSVICVEFQMPDRGNW
jgi:hypothetical protein